MHLQNSSSEHGPSSRNRHADGVLKAAIRISWEDVCVIFDGIYLNWDPSQFAHRIEFHRYTLPVTCLQRPPDVDLP